MITIVTEKDYIGITNAFTKDEIKEKYGRLVVMSQQEYKEYQNKSKTMR